MLSSEQAAYIAGLIDGEGSLECQRQLPKGCPNYAYTPRLAFVLSTEEPLRTVGEWIGHAAKGYPSTSPNRQPRWRMQIPKKLTCAVLRECMPYLILKKRQAELILEIEATRAAGSPPRSLPPGVQRRMPPATLARMEELYRQLRDLKSNKRPAQARI